MRMPWLALWRPLGELPQLAQPRNQMCNMKEPWGFSSLGLLLTPTTAGPQPSTTQLSPSCSGPWEIMINCCFKPLGFEVIHYTAIDSQNTHYGSVQQKFIWSQALWWDLNTKLRQGLHHPWVPIQKCLHSPQLYVLVPSNKWQIWN